MSASLSFARKAYYKAGFMFVHMYTVCFTKEASSSIIKLRVLKGHIRFSHITVFTNRNGIYGIMWDNETEVDSLLLDLLQVNWQHLLSSAAIATGNGKQQMLLD